MTKTVALIPLRGGSKSIPQKNIKTIAGKPLCAWVLEAAVATRGIEATYVSTDCEQIKAVVLGLGLGVEVLDRPAKLATDEASTESVMLHFMNTVDFDRLVTIQATSPLLDSVHLEQALILFEQNQLDSMLSAVRSRRFFWRDDGTPLNYDPRQRPRRQDFEGLLMENGAFYVTCRQTLVDLQCRLGGNVGIFEMPEETALEIDEPLDWNLVEAQLQRKYTL